MDKTVPAEIKSVAVVEDDPAVRGSLKFSLETDGFRVHAFTFAQDLLRVAQALHVDCLVVDHRLQDMTGLELVDRLRRENRHFPAIVLAGHPSEALRQQAEHRQVTVVETPLIGDVLTDRMRALLA